MSSSSVALVEALFVHAQKRRGSPHPQLAHALARCDVLVPIPDNSHPAPDARTFEAITTQLDGARVMVLFSDEDALTRWSRRTINFVRIPAVAALKTALTSGFDGVVFDIAGPAHVRLDRGGIQAILTNLDSGSG